MPGNHARRKADHIRINLDKDVDFPNLTTGLENYRLVHQALPELNLDDVDTSVTVFGKRLRAPLLISSMTGGTAEAGRINLHLAEAAEAAGIAMGLGSQRAGLEESEQAATFQVRRVAPNILLFANLGAVQLNKGYTVEHCQRAVDMVEADALILHLNPLQEAVQVGGDIHWAGLAKKIEAVCKALSVPVIAKEVGWGISPQTARMLADAGVAAIDVAGAGGTSWTEVESHRAPTARMRRIARSFADWGIPTAESLALVRAAIPDMMLFASGGLRNGIDIAKCLALGAGLCGMAGPFLRPATESVEAVADEIDAAVHELKVAMFVAGAGTVEALREPGRLVEVGGRRSEVGGRDFVSAEFASAEFAPAEFASPDATNITQFGKRWIPKVEAYMRQVVSSESEELGGLYGMLRYHLGWEDQQGQPDSAPAGKRVRPLVVLMASQAAGGDPAKAIPAAAAVELLHNFSLIHDDIEDRSPTRRHRTTLWSWVGEAQAINAGDTMFTLARLALLGLSDKGVPPERVLVAQRLFDLMCVHLTEGQYLDISFETRDDVALDEYLIMIAGKTAALLGVSAQLGAIAAGADDATAGHYWRFGHELGLSFQVQDDILGIWGDEAKTGKSAASDILTRKKTLPVLYALEQSGPYAQALHAYYTADRDLTPADLSMVLDLLDRLGARKHAEESARIHAEAALAALAQASGEMGGGALLAELAHKLVGRRH